MTDLAEMRTDHDDPGLTHHTSTGISNEKLAMWAFLGSECLLFGGLIPGAHGPAPRSLARADIIPSDFAAVNIAGADTRFHVGLLAANAAIFSAALTRASASAGSPATSSHSAARSRRAA